jgi:hypothetical protein
MSSPGARGSVKVLRGPGEPPEPPKCFSLSHIPLKSAQGLHDMGFGSADGAWGPDEHQV